MTDPGVTTYLEMRDRPALQVTPPHRSGMLLRLAEPTVSFYRYLRTVTGEEAHEDDAAIAELLADPGIEVFVLSMAGTPAGWFQLDRRSAGEVELTHFGFVPEFTNRGLARYLLAAAVEAAWDHRPARLWVRVPGGIGAHRLLDYQWAGFTPYRVGRDEEDG